MTTTDAPHVPEAAPAAHAAVDTAARARKDVRIFRGPVQWVLGAVVFAVYAWLPTVTNDKWANVLVYCAIIAIAALGLNLLTGYAGQASLGTAAFMAIGAFVASYLGRAPDVFGSEPGRGLPFMVYLPVAIAIGAIVGFLVGLPALRLRGNYLVIVTLGFVFITIWVLNLITPVSGGNPGVAMPRTAQVFGYDFALRFDFFGTRTLTFDGQYKMQGLMYLTWAFVGIVALLVKNIVRSRPGRALQAVRDRDVAAEVVGVSLFRYKVGAFVVSSGIGALAGVMWALYQDRLRPLEEEAFGPTIGLQLSILVLTVMIVGGVGSVYGTVIGALVIGAIPRVVESFSDSLPFIAKPGETGLTAAVFSNLLFSALLVITLVIEPNGIAGTIRKLRLRGMRTRT